METRAPMKRGLDDSKEGKAMDLPDMDIAEDAHAFLGTLRRRAYTLKRRFERNKVPNA